jgi:hypothetical protein
MRTFDLDQYWPSSIAAYESDAKSAATTAAALKNVYPDASARLTAAPQRPSRAAHWQQAEAGAKTHLIAFLASFDTRAAVWLSSGFVAGMVAWHAVGFWGFVSDTVLKRTDRTTSIAWAAPSKIETTATSSITTGSLASYTPEPGTCLALTLNRDNATTTASPCSGSGAPMRDAGRHRRGDRLATAGSRLQDPNAWTAATALNEGPQRDRSSDADFDLTLSGSH